jgi:hypothetical protein
LEDLQLQKQRKTAVCYHLLILLLNNIKPAADTQQSSINLSSIMIPTEVKAVRVSFEVINKKSIKNS